MNVAKAALGWLLLPWRLGTFGERAHVAATARVFHPERVEVGRDAWVGPGSYLIGNTDAPIGIRLGEGVVVERGAYLTATDGSIEIGARAWIGPGAILYGNGGLFVGARAKIGPRVAISTVNHASQRVDLPIRAQGLELAGVHIGADAVIGADVVLVPGVKIGRGAFVAPGSVVTRSIPPGAVVEGVPARLVEERAKCA
jgi:acetyltransferase-like isoleucine patch superfamily enzyme